MPGSRPDIPHGAQNAWDGNQRRPSVTTLVEVLAAEMATSGPAQTELLNRLVDVVLARRFADVTGTSPSLCLTRWRLALAAELLGGDTMVHRACSSMPLRGDFRWTTCRGLPRKERAPWDC